MPRQFTPQRLTVPWKLTCPNCKEDFPKNDFGKHYASCIGETGADHPDKGDRSLLFHTEHPDPNDPLHLYGVDDGTGFLDKDGRRCFLIGFYSHWMQYVLPPTALGALAGTGYVWVAGPLTAGEALVGRQMIIANDGLRNACYTIESVEAESALWKVCLGDVCFVRDPNDYAAGYTYNFAAGASFVIPHTVRVATRVDGAYAVRATGEVTLSVPR